MLGRAFVADVVIPNVKLLEVTLFSENFDVLSVYRGPEAKNI
jgi:hypothetical protein